MRRRPAARSFVPASRAILLAAALGYGGPAAAQDIAIPEAVYPRLAATAASAKDFAPPGWVVEAEVAGDLDGDGVEDVAFVLRETRAANILRDPSLAQDSFDTNPRILAIALGESAGKPFRLIVQNHSLIPRPTNPSADDPFEDRDLSLDKGRLRIGMRLFMSAGGWDSFNAIYTFQVRNGRVVLIGYDRFSVNRGTGRTQALSANFLTGKMKTEAGHISTDARDSPVWSKPRHRRPLPIEAIANGIDFAP